ncbi:MAG: hypothetical protein GEU75_00070 [Dehalococcoidia bacterium]|nr:hypothetical protein [Dehalococcoidia bacterium]
MRPILAVGVVTFLLGGVIGAIIGPASLADEPACESGLVEGSLTLSATGETVDVCYPADWAQGSVAIGNLVGFTTPGLTATRFVSIPRAAAPPEPVTVQASIGILASGPAADIGMPECTFDAPLQDAGEFERCLVSSTTASAVSGRPTQHRVFFVTQAGYVMEGRVSLIMRADAQPTGAQIDAFDQLAGELLEDIDRIAADFAQRSR